jgi:hypothetical protein
MSLKFSGRTRERWIINFIIIKALLNNAKIVILNALQTVCAVLAPMDIYAFMLFF